MPAASAERAAAWLCMAGVLGRVRAEWMAPEVLCCENVHEPADVYSYGVCLWWVPAALLAAAWARLG